MPTKNETPTPEAPPAAPVEHRDVDLIQADIDATKAKLRGMMPAIEKGRIAAGRQADRIDRAKRKWKIDHEPDDPFDPHSFNPPMVPLQGDAKAQKEFHRLHYVSAKFQTELAKAIKAQLTIV